MNPTAATTSPEFPATPAPVHQTPGDPRALLSSLQDMLTDRSVASADAPRAAARRLLLALEQIVAEHQGMADELLHVYEQLGIIFEVTRRLPTVSSEDATLGLFLDSLRRSFHGRTVCVARSATPPRWTFQCNCMDATPDPSIFAALDRVCTVARPRTQVVDLPPLPPAEGRPSQPRQLLIGPVHSGDRLICALLILRDPSQSAAPPFKASDMSLVEALSAFCGDLLHTHHLLAEMRQMSVAMVRALVSAVDQKDPYTCGHSLRVGFYATALGRKLSLPESDLQMLQWSALLHDVGKIGIRDDVLNKQGRLTPEEFEHIKEHPTRSHHVVQQVPQLARALDGILHHHERFDGTGYPHGLSGATIPLQARIIQIADVFDALTSSRSYRPAYDWQKALAIMADDAGKAIDPNLQQLFDAFIRHEMQAGPGAWEKLVQQANAFTGALATEGAELTRQAAGERP